MGMENKEEAAEDIIVGGTHSRMQHSTADKSIIQPYNQTEAKCFTQHSLKQHNTTQHNTTQHYTALHYTTLH
jgi:hypothetical protein